MSIPSKMRPIGFDSWYVRLYRDLLQLLGSPAKFVLDWIAPEKKLIIHTDRVDGTTLTEVAAIAAELVPVEVDIVQYNHNMEISWRDINKYAECTNRADMLTVNPNYVVDLTSEGEWVYPLSEMISAEKLFDRNSDSRVDNLKKATLYMPKAIILKEVCNRCYNLEHVVLTCGGERSEDSGNYPNAYAFSNCLNLKIFEGDLSGIRTFGQGFQNAKSLGTTIFNLNSLYSGNTMFNGCNLNKLTALSIFDSIPSYNGGSHQLTIGIDVNLQNDEELWTAIHNSEVRGWTLEVQWNPGGPTYTTPTT